MAQLLAKPDTFLIEHLRAVVDLAVQLADRLQLSPPLKTKALLAAALHDVGKATPDFQDYLLGKTSHAFPHALTALPFALLVENAVNRHLGISLQQYEATAAVLSHHSPLSPNLYRTYIDCRPPQFHPDIETLLCDLASLLTSLGVPLNVPPDTLLQRALLFNNPAHILESRYKIGQEIRSFRGILQTSPVENFAPVKCVLQLADWLASAGKTDTSSVFLDDTHALVRQHTTRLTGSLRQFQQAAAASTSRPVLWLRAPTGSGKTEALLLWASNASRILYLLPTQATTNAMWRRLRRIFGVNNVGLAHGRASYFLREESEEDPREAQLFGSVFAKPVTVATLDQFLLAHLHCRHWEIRRILAQHSAVILDEIHAYEPYTLGLLRRALEKEPPQRLALASATLPDSLLQLFPTGQLVEAEPELWAKQRHQVACTSGTLVEDGVDHALRLAAEGRSLLIVANTVRDAQQIFRRLKPQCDDRQLTLLHSRFCLRDRRLKEKHITSPSPGSILVSTQVVEVSLDISYEAMLTEIAPLDALVQRLGRVNRYGSKPPAPVIVYQAPSQGTERIYGRQILAWSHELLQSLSPRPTDAELRQIVAQLYDQITASADWNDEIQAGVQTLDEIQHMLGCCTIDLSDPELAGRFTARRGTISIDVLPAEFVDEAYQLMEKKRHSRLPELLVPVPIHWIKIFRDHFTPDRDLNLLIANLCYSFDEGLVLPDESSPPSGGVIIE
jgi:CRISPR-associated endonuclease/helicase Cas3